MAAWDVQVERALDGRDVEEGEEFKLDGRRHDRLASMCGKDVIQGGSRYLSKQNRAVA